MKPEEVKLGRRTVEPYREQVTPTDSRVLDLATRSIALAIQEVEDAAVANRVVEYGAILRYFEDIAKENNGVVPIAAVRDTLQQALEAKI